MTADLVGYDPAKAAGVFTFGGTGCQVYGDCASPVAWCDVGGGHQSGNSKLSSATQAFWATLK